MTAAVIVLVVVFAFAKYAAAIELGEWLQRHKQRKRVRSLRP